MNRKIIAYIIGKLLLVEAGLMLVPLAIALIYQEDAQHVLAFVQAIGLTGLIGLAISFKKPAGVMRAREGAVIVALGWVLMSFFGGLPFVFSGDIPSLVDAFFETSSGFTTTGSSILTALSPLAHSSLFWRSFTHLVGGMGVLVFTLAVLPGTKSDAAQLMRAEVPGPVFGKIVSKVSDTARILYIIYLAMTAVLIVILMIFGGVPLFDASLLAFGTAGTGGFAINDAGFAIYGNPAFVEYAIGIGMLVFGVNFNLYFFMLIKHVKEAISDEELHWYLGIVLAAIVAIVVNLAPHWSNLEETFRHTLFTVSSIITTTGYSTADFGQWPMFSQTILLLLMFVGGCAGSTAGGIKVSRVAIYVKKALASLLSLGHANQVVALRFNKKAISDKEDVKFSNYLMIYALVFVVILLLVALDSQDFMTAFSATAATFNNIGPGLAAVGPTSNFAFYSDFTKIVLSFGMIAGRLEIYPMLILFAPSTLRKFVRRLA